MSWSFYYTLDVSQNFIVFLEYKLYSMTKEKSQDSSMKKNVIIILTKRCLWKEFDENKFFSNRLISQHDLIIHWTEPRYKKRDALFSPPIYQTCCKLKAIAFN